MIGEVGMAPKKGGARKKVTKKRRCCKLCGRKCVKLCTHRCKCKCPPCGKSKKNRRKTKRRNKSKRRKTRVKKGRGWPFSKSKKEREDDERELDKRWGLDGERYKIKGRKPKEITVNMSFAPWEPGFRPENDDPYGDGPFLEKRGEYNRVVPRKPGSRSWPTRANVKLAKAYEKVEEAVKKNQER